MVVVVVMAAVVGVSGSGEIVEESVMVVVTVLSGESL